MSMTSDSVRANFKAGDDVRDAGLTTPEDIVRFDDIVYGPDPAWQVLDVYRPKEAAGKKLPVIVSVHGGGWVYGDKERYQFYCMSLAQRGFAVVNFTYRLAPEHKFPAPLEDTNRVFTWVLTNAETYGFDVNHIFAVGDSAGAHILGLYCGICTDPVYAENYDFTPPAGFAPTAVALNCGAYRIDVSARDMTAALMADFLPEGGSPRELALIQVADHVTSHFPPTLLMTCTGDFLKEQAPIMVRKLMDMDVPFMYRYYGDKEKRLPHVFHCDMRSADAAGCNDDECGFFKTFC